MSPPGVIGTERCGQTVPIPPPDFSAAEAQRGSITSIHPRHVTGQQGVVFGLRTLADRIERGEYGKAEMAIIVLDTDKSFNVIVRGTRQTLNYTIGLLERAKHMEIDYGAGRIEESE